MAWRTGQIDASTTILANGSYLRGTGLLQRARLELKMDHSAHADHGRASDPHAGRKMSDLHEAHDRHAGHSAAMFRDKFWLSLALTIPVVLWSADVQRWLGYMAPSFPGSSFIP